MTDVVATILGQRVQGQLVEERHDADIATGPQRDFVVDVDGAHFRVPDDAVQQVEG